MISIRGKNKAQLNNFDLFLRNTYLFFKAVIPRRIQLFLRRSYISRQRFYYQHIWPIDEKAKTLPPEWNGWPDGKQFALILTHDVETERGQEGCIRLAELERTLGFRSSFNFIAKEYKISPDIQEYLKKSGFEVGVHGLVHNGNIFKSRREFERQAIEINRYLEEWDAVGFRCPSMYHNLDWIGELNIEYDSSTFDTDPFEPQPDGVTTIFPFWVQGALQDKGFVELPYTLPQDFSLFVLMKERNIDIWKNKLNWIAEKRGMALLITHPDYMDFGRRRCEIGRYPVEFYEEFLGYLNSRYGEQYWHPLSKEMACFWRKKYKEKRKVICDSAKSGT